MNSLYLDAIRNFEGFASRAEWDYAQHTNGFGTRAMYPGEVIDRAEAERRFKTEIAAARSIVERHAPDVDEGTKAALTSLTFNAGTRWINDGLGEAVRRGDLETARSLFLEYNKAGGKMLAGLVARRAAEAEWFGNGGQGIAALPTQTAAVPQSQEAWATQSVPATENAVPGETARTGVARVLAAAEGSVAAGTSPTDPGAGALLMALRLHMALAASARLQQAEDERTGEASSVQAQPGIRSA